MSVKSTFQLEESNRATATLTLTTQVRTFQAAVEQIEEGNTERYEARQIIQAMRDVVRKATSGEWHFVEDEDDE